MLFGTNGFRTKNHDPILLYKLGYAIGKFFKSRNIIVGTDHRLTREIYKHSVISGILSAGKNTEDIGIIPSPIVEFYAREKKEPAVIITASHNPYEYNGVKITDGRGVALSKERAAELEKLMQKVKVELSNAKTTRNYSVIGEYKAYISNKLNKPNRKLKAVLDYGGGTVSLVASSMIKNMGVEITTIHSELDPYFRGRPSEPREEYLQKLKEMVVEEGADIGIAWDGDGDRVVFIDENGKFIQGDRSFAILSKAYLSEHPGNIITTVATSRVLEDVARTIGRRVIYTKVGAPYISEKLLEEGEGIAGEEVGGVIWKDISLGKDGIYTALKLIELLEDRSLSELNRELPEYYNIKDRVECPNESKNRIIEEIKQELGSNAITIDGIRINFENSWVIIRPSGTEPYIRVFAEAKTKEEAKELVRRYKKEVEKRI